MLVVVDRICRTTFENVSPSRGVIEHAMLDSVHCAVDVTDAPFFGTPQPPYPSYDGVLTTFYPIGLDWIGLCSVLRLRQHSIGWRRFLQVKRSNQQYQSTEGDG